jgi:mono/diheme cytochrome c family protein
MRAVLGILLSVVAVAAAIAAIGIASIRHRGLSSRRSAGATETAIARWLRDWSLPAEYGQLRNPVACGDETLREARAHWADHCAGCHANNSSGDSLFGKTMFPRPPDMRGPATQNESDGALYYAIDNGVPLTGMPAFGKPGASDTDSWMLVCFIRHLPSMPAEEEWEMRKLNPKTDSEREEEREEELFLNGGTKK